MALYMNNKHGKISTVLWHDFFETTFTSDDFLVSFVSLLVLTCNYGHVVQMMASF